MTGTIAAADPGHNISTCFDGCAGRTRYGRRCRCACHTPVVHPRLPGVSSLMRSGVAA